MPPLEEQAPGVAIVALLLSSVLLLMWLMDIVN
jgi:hypothetical protein